MLPFSDADRALLQCAQHHRLRSFFAETLLHCVLQTTDDRLLVYCPGSISLAPLTTAIEDFQEFAYLTTGTTAIILYHERIEVLRCTRESQAPSGDRVDYDLTFFGEEESIMATATLERTQTETSFKDASVMPAVSLADLATDVEQPLEDVRSWVAAAGVPIIGFQGYELIAAPHAASAYDYFEPLLLQQRRAKRGLPIAMTPAMPAPAIAETNGNGTKPAAKVAEKKAAAKPAAKVAEKKAEAKPAARSAKKATAKPPQT